MLAVIGMTSTEFFQAVADGLILGSVWGLLGCGFGLILGVTGRFHFAFATSFVIAIYMAVEFVSIGAPLYVGILGGIVCGAIAGVACERLLYSPLVKRTSQGLLAVFVTSLGIVIVGTNLIQLIGGSSSQTLSTGYVVNRLSLGGDVGVTTLDVVTVATCVVIILALWVFMRFTSHGRAVRAVQENPDMACAVGISPDRMYLLVFAIGSVLAGVGGVLLTQRGAAAPDSGVAPTFTALVVAFLAGMRSSPLRLFAVGLIVGLIQQLCLIKISAAWSDVVTFGLLFVYIAISPFFAQRRVSWRPSVFRRWVPQG